MIFRFIKLIPAFFRLFCDYEMKPEDIRFSLEQYTIVINRLTGGRMSKVNYYADDIVSVVNDIYCDGCDYRDGEPEAKNVDAFVQWCSDSHIVGDATIRGIKYWAEKFKEGR